jgi:O-antigen/teichoic acid export membrane protein
VTEAIRWRRLQDPSLRLLLAQVCVGASAAAANVLMARALAPSGRGSVALLLQVGYLASQILLLGSERSFIAVYTGSSPAAAVRAYTRLALAPCAAGVAVVAVVAATTPAGAGPARTTLVVVTAFAVVNVLVQAVRAIAIATGRHSGFLGYTVLSQLALLAVLTVLYLAEVTGPVTWFTGYLLAGAFPTAVCWILWSRRGGAPPPPGDALADADKRRAVRREGVVLFPAAIANMGMLHIDRLILPALASTAALGLYATVATMTALLAWPLQAYADSRLGVWRAAHRQRRRDPSPGALSAAVYALVVAPIAGGVMYVLIVPVFGPRYEPAKALILPLICAATAYGWSRVSLARLVAQGRNATASAAEVSGFAVSLAAYLLLIPTHGALGAAVGSLVGYGCCLVYAEAALRRPTGGGGHDAPRGPGRTGLVDDAGHRPARRLSPARLRVGGRAAP